MDLLSIVFISIGLAADAFAVAVSCGISDSGNTFVNALKAGAAFGFFQAGMAVLGWFAGSSFKSWIEPVDHWIAFALLGFVGSKMIKESMEGSSKPINLNETKVLLALSVATSLDALAAGISIATLGIYVLLPAALIGTITFILSYLGVYLGRAAYRKTKIRSYIEVAGGLILIGIGFKILLENMF